MAAAVKARDALLKHPKNRRRRVCNVEAAGHVIAPCVSTPTIKKDKVTKKLAKINPYKMRHSFDHKKWNKRPQAAAHDAFEPSSSTVVDDMVLQM